MRFADLHAGQEIWAGPHRVDEASILAFAREYDPQWFHTDPEASAESRWGGLIASGWQTCGIAMKLAVEKVLAGSESFGSPGLAYLKWLSPVRPGDELRLKLTVIEARRSERNPRIGVLRWRWQLFKQGDLEVLDTEATSLFELPVA
jgi:acyl dehydratase